MRGGRKPQIGLARIISAIAKRSEGVRWFSHASGFCLGRTLVGYVLTTEPQQFADALPNRVVLPREDGSPMPDGHILTARERERAVRLILEN